MEEKEQSCYPINVTELNLWPMCVLYGNINNTNTLNLTSEAWYVNESNKLQENDIWNWHGLKLMLYSTVFLSN